MSSIDVAGAIRSILSGDHNLNSELSTAMISLASAVDQLKNQQNQLKAQQDQLKNQQETASKEIETVRRMTRTNWLLVINLPLPFGLSKGQALQSFLDSLNYAKPLFDAERDLLAADILYVNRGSTCNMAFFVAQRHHDFLMSAEFQRRLVASNQKVPRERWITVGRVLTPEERKSYDTACALKRLIVAHMTMKKRQDPKFTAQFVLVDKRTLRLRIDKQYYTLEDASARFSISSEAIAAEVQKHQASSGANEANERNKSKRQADADGTEGPSNKMQKL